MNQYRTRAITLKHQLRIAAQIEGNPNHIKHLEQYFEYADAVALATAQDVLNQIARKMAQDKKKEANIEVDPKTVKKVKDAINEMLSPLKTHFR